MKTSKNIWPSLAITIFSVKDKTFSHHRIRHPHHFPHHSLCTSHTVSLLSSAKCNKHTAASSLRFLLMILSGVWLAPPFFQISAQCHPQRGLPENTFQNSISYFILFSGFMYCHNSFCGFFFSLSFSFSHIHSIYLIMVCPPQ